MFKKLSYVESLKKAHSIRQGKSLRKMKYKAVKAIVQDDIYGLKVGMKIIWARFKSKVFSKGSRQ